MLDIQEIRKKLGDHILKDNDCIPYSISKAVESFAIGHFGRIPYMNQLTDRVFDKIDPTRISGLGSNDSLPLFKSDCDEQEYREKMQNIDMGETIENIIKAYPDVIEYNYRMAKKEDVILFHDEFIYYDGVFYMDTNVIPDKMYECVVEKEMKAQIRWVLRNSHGRIENKYMEISPKGNMEDNYNDDFMPVHEKIVKLINSDESSIIILHGKPGTGKTSYIRDLISENSDVMFYWLDSSMFGLVDSSEFINFIASCKNSVFILEDSECLLASRENGGNTAMQTLLSISDGMLGDSLKLKFICTFNTDMKNIDSAILRKGRMRVKYEFKDLKKEKVAKIFSKIGIDEKEAKDMPLCDVYNYLEENGNKVTRTKIGF